jgi:hypothetical protein
MGAESVLNCAGGDICAEMGMLRAIKCRFKHLVAEPSLVELMLRIDEQELMPKKTSRL